MALDLRRARPVRVARWWAVLAVLAVVVVGLGLLVAGGWGPLLDLDRTVGRWAYDGAAGDAGWTTFLDHVAQASEPVWLRAVLVVVALVALLRRELRVAVFLLLVVIAENVLAPLGKAVVDRPRPSFGPELIEIGGSSFPSGHAAGIGFFATALVLLTIVATPRGLLRNGLVVLEVALVVLVGADRVLLGVHYLSDVVGGVALGVLVSLAGWLLVMRGGTPGPTTLVTTTGTGARRVASIYNPMKVGDEQVFRALVRAAAADAGWREPLFWPTTAEDPGTSMAHDALAAGVDLVLVAGGDGTVRVVCDELARTGVALGVIPLGTGNLLARNLGIPLHTGDAVKVAFTGQDRAVDVVTYTGDATAPVEGVDDEDAGPRPPARTTCFTVMAGLGMDAAIMTGAPDQLKARVGWVAYVVSGVRQLRYPAVKVEISVDGGEFRRYRARTVVVGNVGQLQGGIPLLPDARVDDGVLDVVVITPRRMLTWLRVIARVVTRRRLTDERLDRLTGQQVVVRAEQPTACQLDGDPIGEGTGFTAEIQPGVLLVRVPS